jgi:L-threonylcarbamoyladenylate synthase
MVIDGNRIEAVSTAHAILSRGGVAVIPTDTIYGFSGLAPDTEKRIRALKGRGENKPILMLIANPDWISAWSDVPLPPALRPFWPGPLTLIFPGRAPGKTYAFRLPDHAFLIAVLQRIGRPVYSTSVNRAGEPFLWKIDDIIKRFESRVDLIVTAGDRPGSAPSTILDLSTRPYTVVRQGETVIPEELLK